MSTTGPLLPLVVASITVAMPAPALPGEVEALASRMAAIGECSSPDFSPDGARIVFVSNLTGVPQVWTVSAGGGWPRLVTTMPDQVSRVSWSPAGDWLAFSVAPGGGMNSQIYIIRPDGTGLRMITDGGKDNNWLGVWSHDGGFLTISSNRAHPGSMDVFAYDLASGRLRLLAANPGIGTIGGISRDRRRATVWRMRNRSDSDLFVLDLDGGEEERLLTPHEGPGRFEGGLFSPDGSAVYLSSDKDRDLPAFARVVLDQAGRPGSVEILAARDDAELDDFAITEDGATAALVWNRAGRSDLSFLDLRTGKSRPGPALPAEIVRRIVFSKDGRALAIALSGSAAPGDIWVLDMASSRLEQITFSPHAGVDTKKLVRPDLVGFTAHDGLALTAWLYRPPGFVAPGPVVLSFHGGPEGQERPGFRSTYQALLARGIAVFAPNVRGSSGFGKRFVNLDNGALRTNAIRDIKSCVDHLVRSGVARQGHVGIMGGSYGGYMTMAGLAEYPDLFAAGADLFGVVNFETFFSHTEPWMAAISGVEYGDPVTERQMLRDLSPIHKIDRVRAPTLVLHGANDTNVPVVEAEQVVESLKRRGIPVEFVLFPDEGHGFSREPNRIRTTISIVQWFETYLKGES